MRSCRSVSNVARVDRSLPGWRGQGYSMPTVCSAHAYTYIYMFIYIYIIFIYIYIYVHKYIYIYVYIHTHVYSFYTHIFLALSSSQCTAANTEPTSALPLGSAPAPPGR